MQPQCHWKTDLKMHQSSWEIPGKHTDQHDALVFKWRHLNLCQVGNYRNITLLILPWHFSCSGSEKYFWELVSESSPLASLKGRITSNLQEYSERSSYNKILLPWWEWSRWQCPRHRSARSHCMVWWVWRWCKSYAMAFTVTRFWSMLNMFFTKWEKEITKWASFFREDAVLPCDKQNWRSLWWNNTLQRHFLLYI